MSGYAQVVVDLSAEAVDRQFTYAVPDGMALTPGQLVAVPFGPRTLEGFVISLSEECDLPAERGSRCCGWCARSRWCCRT